MTVLRSTYSVGAIARVGRTWDVPAEEQKVRTRGQHDDHGYTVLGLVVARQSQRRYGHHEQAREQEHHSRRRYGLWKKKLKKKLI